MRSSSRERWDRCLFAFLHLFLFVPFLFITSSATAVAAPIKDYRQIFLPGYDTEGRLRIAIRRYEKEAVSYLLLVNPETLETSTIKALAFDTGKGIPPAALRNTPFVRALSLATSPPYRLQNHGAIRSDHPVDGLFLTVDLCPSKRPFERELFETVAHLPQRREGAVPVAIAVTGVWMEQHKPELAWIAGQVEAGNLEVTWVNHSYHHPYAPQAPLERTFLLTPGTDIEQEVLATELLLLENGFVPAPFFRFPGLVADGELVKKLRELSLIPVGSDAWLAKGEMPRDGSFILVHGNGNEPQGIKKALPLLRERKNVRLLPLRRAFSGVPP